MSELRIARIEELMGIYGMGPVELAESSGLSYNFIYRLRKGERADMSASSLAMLARALATSTDYLLGLTDDPSPSGAPALGEARLTYRVTEEGEFEQAQRLAYLVNQMAPDQRAAFLGFAEAVMGGGSGTQGRSDSADDDAT
ncbi:MAG: helix-turn-helix transcriptional regulator [Caldilinea sp.]|nr:helix-turn-helix transcriptional regulator [Caldilinea sp.]